MILHQRRFFEYRNPFQQPVSTKISVKDGALGLHELILFEAEGNTMGNLFSCIPLLKLPPLNMAIRLTTCLVVITLVIRFANVELTFGQQQRVHFIAFVAGQLHRTRLLTLRFVSERRCNYGIATRCPYLPHLSVQGSCISKKSLQRLS